VEAEPERETDAGLARVLNKRTVSRPPCSFEGKCTFLGIEEGEAGDAGAELARVWLVVVDGECSWEEGMLGGEEGDFRDDFRGLPLERRMGVEEMLGRGDSGVGVGGEDREEEHGKGIAFGKSKLRSNGTVLMGMLMFLSSSSSALESSSSSSGVVAQLLEESSWES
jgi:hypothetical protein